MYKFVILAFFAIIAVANCGIYSAAYVAPYATSYNAHTVNHAVAAPLITPSAKIVAASPYTYPYASYPYSAYSAYSAYPYYYK